MSAAKPGGIQSDGRRGLLQNVNLCKQGGKGEEVVSVQTFTHNFF